MTMSDRISVPSDRSLDLSGFVPSGFGFRGRPLYRIADQTWEPSDQGNELKLILGEDGNWTHITLRRKFGEPSLIEWSWSHKQAEEIFVFHSGSEATIEAAAAVSLAYAPTAIEIAGTPWLELSDTNWFGVIDGEKATIRLVRYPDGRQRYFWERDHKAAAPLLALLKIPAVGSDADSLDQAALGAWSVPGDLARAALSLFTGTEATAGNNEAFARGWQLGRADLKAAMLAVDDALVAGGAE